MVKPISQSVMQQNNCLRGLVQSREAEIDALKAEVERLKGERAIFIRNNNEDQAELAELRKDKAFRW